MKPLLFSVLAGLGFGTSLFFRKLSVGKIGVAGFIIEAFVETIFAIIAVSIIFPFKIQDIFAKPNGILFAVLAGIVVGIGTISFYLAARSGPATLPSVIAPVLSATTGTLLAVVILREGISLIKLIGILITFIGLYIFISFK